MIRVHIVTIEDDITGALSEPVEIPSVFGPALRSALEDLQNTIGERLVGVHKFEREDALTNAATALAPLRAAFNEVIPAGDPNFDA